MGDPIVWILPVPGPVPGGNGGVVPPWLQGAPRAPERVASGVRGDHERLDCFVAVRGGERLTVRVHDLEQQGVHVAAGEVDRGARELRACGVVCGDGESLGGVAHG